MISDDMRTSEQTNDIMTIPASLAGLPALVGSWPQTLDSEVRVGDDSQGDTSMPVGLQIMAQYGNDKLLFEVGKLMFG